MSDKHRDKENKRSQMSERELDEILANLVNNARRYPSGSQERKHALIELIQEVFHQYFRIARSSNNLINKYPQPLREEIAVTALSNIMLYLCEDDKNIEKYDPTRGVKFLSWLIMKLDYPGGFFDKAHSELVMFGSSQKQREDLSRINVEALTTDNLWSSLEPTTAHELLEEIRGDRDDILKSKTMRSTPQVNWRDLALKRMEKSWKQIAEEDYRDLGVKPSALSNFFFRAIKNDKQIKALIDKYGQRQERSKNK